MTDRRAFRALVEAAEILVLPGPLNAHGPLDGAPWNVHANAA